jgi:hypothetical protein
VVKCHAGKLQRLATQQRGTFFKGINYQGFPVFQFQKVDRPDLFISSFALSVCHVERSADEPVSEMLDFTE